MVLWAWCALGGAVSFLGFVSGPCDKQWWSGCCRQTACIHPCQDLWMDCCSVAQRLSHEPIFPAALSCAHQNNSVLGLAMNASSLWVQKGRLLLLILITPCFLPLKPSPDARLTSRALKGATCLLETIFKLWMKTPPPPRNPIPFAFSFFALSQVVLGRISEMNSRIGAFTKCYCCKNKREKSIDGKKRGGGTHISFNYY